MRKGIVLRFALIAALATVTTGLACGEGALDRGLGPSTRSLTGTWQGQIIIDLTMRLVLTEASGTVVGTGTMTQSGVPFSLSVSGSATNGSFTIEVSEVGHAPFTYTGTVEIAQGSTTMTGVANGAGFTNQPLTLTRQ